MHKFKELINSPTRFFGMAGRVVPPLQLSSGALEILKWVALISMVWDHALRYLMGGDVIGPATAFGRLAFPLFAFTFAYGFARLPSNDARDLRILRRLAFFGLLAQPAVFYFWGVYPLNILFTFFIAVALILLLRHKEKGWTVIAAALLFSVGGMAVEYIFVGLILILSFYFWVKTGTHPLSLGALVLSYALLNLLNGSSWALFSFPFIILSMLWSFRVPRSKLFFYIFYPAHLTVIALVHFFLYGGPPAHGL